MNYFLSNLFRDKMLWGAFGLAALAGLIIVDLLTFMLTPRAVFGLWTVKIAAGAAVVGAIACGAFLSRREKKERRLQAMLPGFIEQRRAFFLEKTGECRDFQTFCHECRHFDHNRLGCLLVLRERKVRIQLDVDSPFRYCLYWDLEDKHPLLQLTPRRKRSHSGEGNGPGPRFSRH